MRQAMRKTQRGLVEDDRSHPSVPTPPPNRALRIYPELGNMGAAGVPLTLAKTIEVDRRKPGGRVALMGIGSGLNCQMMGVSW